MRARGRWPWMTVRSDWTDGWGHRFSRRVGPDADCGRLGWRAAVRRQLGRAVARQLRVGGPGHDRGGGRARRWVTRAWRYLVSRGGRGCVAGSYGLYTGADGGIALYVFDGLNYVVSATARPADVWNGSWHHVAGTFDGRALRLFLDGRPVGDPMSAPLRIDYGTTSPHASFGQYVGECNLSFRGDLDLVRLWSGVRSDAAISETATNTVGAPPATGPLPSAAPGTVIDSPARRGCVVQILGTRARSKRPTLVRVRVTNRKRPLRAARVVARLASKRSVLASARTNRAGRARLALPRKRFKRVRISVRGRPRCGSAVVGARL